MIVLSEPQLNALEQIKKINNFEPGRWFTQMELSRVTLHTMRALETKGFLRVNEVEELGVVYYQYTEKERK